MLNVPKYIALSVMVTWGGPYWLKGFFEFAGHVGGICVT